MDGSTKLVDAYEPEKIDGVDSPECDSEGLEKNIDGIGSPECENQSGDDFAHEDVDTLVSVEVNDSDHKNLTTVCMIVVPCLSSDYCSLLQIHEDHIFDYS
ncbi:hypothetical protein L1987_55999 [Smallanthus sonchifolius]|uniref:Uncharacterized protein n=1 Tax=Smallanthus sonchifolius TaxID=185202 RepID=A0ACB9EC57_9ASTR|nr:hypothetical protein L1987_55999 [Smallanthus sonchifolius]